MEEESNPWSGNDMEHFLQYCCPECEIRCQLKEAFVLHAMEHPKYIDSLKKVTFKEVSTNENYASKIVKSPKNNYELSNKNVKYYISDDLNYSEEEEINTDNSSKELSNLVENTTIELSLIHI